jgi:hypothetical protein
LLLLVTLLHSLQKLPRDGQSASASPCQTR